MKTNPWNMNLQLFAEPADGQQANQEPNGANGTDPNANAGSGSGANAINLNAANPSSQQSGQQQNQQNQQGEGQQNGQQQAQRTFTQDDVNRIVAERLSRERRDMQQQIDAARQEGRTEAERLAQMSAEERARHEQEQAQQEAQRREQQLQQREAEITRRELRAQAIETLMSRDLPRELESMLDYSSADACNASIATIERVYRAAVQQGVDARLRASGVNLPAPGSQPDYAHMSDADYYAATMKK